MLSYCETEVPVFIARLKGLYSFSYEQDDIYFQILLLLDIVIGKKMIIFIMCGKFLSHSYNIFDNNSSNRPTCEWLYMFVSHKECYSVLNWWIKIQNYNRKKLCNLKHSVINHTFERQCEYLHYLSRWLKALDSHEHQDHSQICFHYSSIS